MKVGPTILIVEFYEKPDPNPNTDKSIGTLMMMQDVKNQPNMITINTTLAPDSVVVTPNQTVAVGQTLQLMFTAYNKGMAIPIPKGEAVPGVPVQTIGFVSQAGRLSSPDNIHVTGIASGTPTVQVTVNTANPDAPSGYVSKTSDAVAVTVTSNVLIAVMPSTVTLNVQTGTQQFSAQVRDMQTVPLC